MIMTSIVRRSLLGATQMSLVASAGYSGDGTAPGTKTCDVWAKGALKKVESKRVPEWRDAAIAAIARACEDLPASLRTAAAEYKKAKSDKDRAQALAKGAGTVLKGDCVARDPEDFATALLGACPLAIPEEKQPSATALGLMRAGEYLFLNAFTTSLIAANAYDDSAHRIVLDFVLSSANAGEARKKAVLHRRAK
jgi:hypothetical protein